MWQSYAGRQEGYAEPHNAHPHNERRKRHVRRWLIKKRDGIYVKLFRVEGLGHFREMRPI